VTRCAFSLLEMLVALTLMISVAVVAVGWLDQIGRTNAAFARERAFTEAVSATIDLLRDDCALAVAPPTLSEDGTLVLRCLSPSGAVTPGLREVRWIHHSTQNLLVRTVMSEAPSTLVVGSPVPNLPWGTLTDAFVTWRVQCQRGVLEVQASGPEERQVQRRVWVWPQAGDV